MLEDRTAPALFSWTGMGMDGQWGTPTNWDLNAVPTYLDDANLAFGSAAVTGAASILNLTLSGGALSGPGTLTVLGTMNWTGGTLSDTGSTPIMPPPPPGTPGDSPGTLDLDYGAVLNISGYGMKTIHGWTINAGGIINWTQGDVNNAQSTVNIEAGGVFNISTASTWNDEFGDGLSSINNAGTIVSTGGMMGMPVAIEAALNVTGTLQVDAGTLALNAGGFFDGNLYVADQANFELLEGDFVVQAINAPAPIALHDRSLTIGGGSNLVRVIINAGTDNYVENLTLRTGGTIGGAGDLIVTQELNWTGGAMTGGGVGGTSIWGTMAISGNVSSSREIGNWGATGLLAGNTLTLTDCNFRNFSEFTLQGATTVAGNLGSRFFNEIGAGSAAELPPPPPTDPYVPN